MIRDSMSVLALLAMALSLAAAVYSAYSAWRERDAWRRGVYIVGAGLGLYTAVSYVIVLLVERGAQIEIR